MTTYVLAGGCFWCLDAVYERLRGVVSVVSGYTGGTVKNPSYAEVCTGTTGHVEATVVTFDEAIIPSDTILDIFFLIHNPTTRDRQGADVGPQYRSVMFYADETQRQAFKAALQRAQQHWDDPIVTELQPLGEFYPADDEHQDYYTNNPEAGYCRMVITPKISKARAAYASWFKED